MQNFTLSMALFKRVALIIILVMFQPAFAESIEAKSFTDSTQEQRYRTLIDEIRCPVCQGQSIGGSNAGLAKDLREKVRELILDNQNDDAIRQYMTDRYGDFVVFKPPMNQSTYLLWYAPFVFLVLGLFAFIRSLGGKSAKKTQAIDTQKAKDLLK